MLCVLPGRTSRSVPDGEVSGLVSCRYGSRFVSLPMLDACCSKWVIRIQGTGRGRITCQGHLSLSLSLSLSLDPASTSIMYDTGGTDDIVCTTKGYISNNVSYLVLSTNNKSDLRLLLII